MDTLSPDSSIAQSSAGGAAVVQPPQAADDAAPRLVIRGTSTQEDKSGELAHPRTKVDYLTASCEADDGAIGDCLAEMFKGGVAPVDLEWGPPMRHFTKSARITVAGVPCGSIMWGGETQRDRACVDINGRGCGMVPDWTRAEEALLGLPDVAWTRADIAADFFRGEVSHERVKQAHAEGKFLRGGRNPVLREIISTNEDEGRTIYVGKRGGDALGRFYEKGKKEYWGPTNKTIRRLAGSPHVLTTDSCLNDGEQFDLAEWYRAELELRAKNRPVPDDWISRRDEYFAGAYPFLGELLPQVEPRFIVRPRHLGIIAIERAIETMRLQWGPTLYTALAYCRGDQLALCRRILGEHHSPRLVAAGALLALDGQINAHT